MRIVLDTNVLLRVASAGDRSRLFQLWQEQRFTLLLSLAMLTEFATLAARPALQRYLPESVSGAFIGLLAE